MFYKGSNKIEEVYYGSTKIQEIYKGSTLLYSAGYPSGTILVERRIPGSQTLTVKYACRVHVDIVGGGGGGGGGASAFSNAGGSGAYIHGDMDLLPGNYYLKFGNGGSIREDGEDTYFSSTLNNPQNVAGGGKGSTISPGKGGTTSNVTTGLIAENGKRGDTVGWINGYGAGGEPESYGSIGYVKIVVI